MNEHVNAPRGRPVTSQHAGVTVTRVGVNLGAEISGVDLRRPVSDGQFQAIDNALVENELIIFRDQDINSEQLMSFGRRFGVLTVHPFAPNEGKNAPELIKFRNDETTPPFGTDVWHSDETFRDEPPMATILCAKEVPAVGGDTMFVSMSAAFDGLSDRMQQYILGLDAIHDMKPFRPLFGKSEEERKNLQHFELMYPPQLHPVVRIHPVTGRKSLFLASHIGTIVGWPRPEAMAFIRDLIEHATQAQFVYVHRWTQHDLVIWDNRTTMHRVRRFDDLNVVRDVRRTTTKSDGPTVAQEAA